MPLFFISKVLLHPEALDIDSISPYQGNAFLYQVQAAFLCF